VVTVFLELGVEGRNQTNESLAARLAMKMGEPGVAVIGEVGGGALEILGVDLPEHILYPCRNWTFDHAAVSHVVFPRSGYIDSTLAHEKQSRSHLFSL
jgi:hypothetical protein